MPLETHSFEIMLPSSTSLDQAESIVTEQIVFPKMVSEGKSSFADVSVRTRYSTDQPGVAKFVGSYMM